MTPPITSQKHIVVSPEGGIKITEHFDQVNGRTRAGKNGKQVMCPVCQCKNRVYHFSWSSMTCTSCKSDVEKEKWLVDQLDTWRTSR